MRTRTLAMATAAVFTLCGLPAGPLAAQTIHSGFDSTLEGWTGQGGTVSHAAGGYLQQLDTQGTWMSVSAPAAFHGDLSAYLNGTLSFDARNLNGVAADLGSAPWFGRVVITGPGGSALRDVAGSGAGQPGPGLGWITYGATLDAASWSGNLAGALAQVNAITVTLEFNDAIVELAGLDNFRVTAVPEPSTALLAVLGGAMLGLRQRLARRRRGGAAASATLAGLAACGLLAATAPAHAGPMRVESAGVFSADTPLTAFSAPGASWSFSFTVDSQPVPIIEDRLFSPGYYVAVPFRDFAMQVGGVEIGQPVWLVLYSAAAAGGMDLIFGELELEPVYRYDSIGTFGDAYYEGDELAPSIVAGTYTTFHPSHGGVYVKTDELEFYQRSSVVTITALPVSAPGTALLLAAGLAALACTRRRAT